MFFFFDIRLQIIILGYARRPIWISKHHGQSNHTISNLPTFVYFKFYNNIYL